MFSHMFLLFSSLLSYSRIFAILPLTSFFAPVLAARESDFSSRFLVPLALWASMLYMHPHISGTKRMGFLKQDARGNLVVDSLLVIFPFPPFAKGFWCKPLMGERKSYLSYSQKTSNWHFLMWPKPCWATQYSSGKESSRDFQTCE